MRLLLLGAACVLLVQVSLSVSSCEGSPNPFPTIDANFTKVASHQFG
jgi:hypothetical protein